MSEASSGWVGNRLARWFAAVLVLGIIAGSFMPPRAKVFFGTTLRYQAIPIPGMHMYVNLHRTLHVAVFGLMAWLLDCLMQSSRNRILMAILVCSLAFFIEKGETVVYRIPMEWADVIDDFSGIAAALLITVLWRIRRGTSNPATAGK